MGWVTLWYHKQRWWYIAGLPVQSYTTDCTSEWLNLKAWMKNNIQPSLWISPHYADTTLCKRAYIWRDHVRQSNCVIVSGMYNLQPIVKPIGGAPQHFFLKQSHTLRNLMAYSVFFQIDARNTNCATHVEATYSVLFAFSQEATYEVNTMWVTLWCLIALRHTCSWHLSTFNYVRRSLLIP